MIWLTIVLALMGAIAVLYNRLVRARNRVDTAWSDIDVQLQRRHDLVPNLVRVVQAAPQIGLLQRLPARLLGGSR